MEINEQMQGLFSNLRDIAQAHPDKLPQVLASLLATPPFRPVIQNDEYLGKVVKLARQIAAAQSKQNAGGA